MDKLKKFLKSETGMYLIFGVLTTIVSAGIYFVVQKLYGNIILSNALSNIGGILFSYISSKKWVFKYKQDDAKAARKEFYIFVFSRLAIFVGETYVLKFMVEQMGCEPNLSKLFTMSCVAIGNYFASKFLVFKKH